MLLVFVQTAFTQLSHFHLRVSSNYIKDPFVNRSWIWNLATMYKYRVTHVPSKLLRKSMSTLYLTAYLQWTCASKLSMGTVHPLAGHIFVPMVLGPYFVMVMALHLSLSLGMCFWPMWAILVTLPFASSLWGMRDFRETKMNKKLEGKS